MEKLQLGYISSYEANQYKYLPMPYMIIEHEAYKELGCGEKILYTLMLNRLALSEINQDRFTDAKGRLYIIYTIEQIKNNMNCSNKTAIKYLENLSEIGLIEKVRQGQGKPALIYVKDFASIDRQAKIKSEKKEKEMIGKHKNIVLTKTQIEALKENYGEQYTSLINLSSEKIFGRSPDLPEIKNMYLFILKIAESENIKTIQQLRELEKAKEEMSRNNPANILLEKIEKEKQEVVVYRNWAAENPETKDLYLEKKKLLNDFSKSEKTLRAVKEYNEKIKSLDEEIKKIAVKNKIKVPI